MLKALIVDDEAHARDAIRTVLENYCSDVNIVGEADGVQTGFDIINKEMPDLVLLDINMQDGSGFDLLMKFEDPDFIPIFITAFDEYAIKAFKYSALDYLVKPIDPEELENAIKRAKKLYDKRDLLTQIEALNSNILSKLSEPKKIVLKTESNIYVKDVSEIIHCESEGNYTSVFFNNGERIVVSKIIKEFEEILPINTFFRIHQSHLINLNYLSGYDKIKGKVIMRNKKELPVSTRRKNSFIELLNKL
jgi:two-component system LytT family response regulator